LDYYNEAAKVRKETKGKGNNDVSHRDIDQSSGNQLGNTITKDLESQRSNIDLITNSVRLSHNPRDGNKSINLENIDNP